MATAGTQSMRMRFFDFSLFSMLRRVSGYGPNGNKQSLRDGEQYRNYLVVAKYYTK
jgi:hypothetical protein